MRYVLLFALTIRILLPILAILITHDPSVFHQQDSSAYIELAKTLTFKFQFATDRPEIFRTPGYPVFLIPGVLLDRVEIVAIALQIAVGVLTVYFVYRIALAVFKEERAAYCGALLYAIEPQSILYSSKILTETLFTGLITAFLVFLFYYAINGKIHSLFFAALFLSASVYVRPISFYLPFIFCIFVFRFSMATGNPAVRSALHGFTFLAVCGVLVGMWNVRNHREAEYSGFSSVSDYNLYFYQAASVLAVEKGVSYTVMRQQLGAENQAEYYEKHPEQRQWPEGEVSRYMRREALRVLLRNPFSYAAIHLKGVLRVMLDPGLEYLKLFKLYPQSAGLLGQIVDQGVIRTFIRLRTQSPLVFWSSGVLFMTLVLYWLAASAGLWLAWCSHPAGSIVILLLVFYFVSLSGGPNSLERFRHPVMPMLCSLAGYAISRGFKAPSDPGFALARENLSAIQKVR